MKQMVDKLNWSIDHNPFSKLCKMEVLEAEEGYVKGRMPLLEEYTNPYQGMHGGCLYALADTMAGLAGVTYGNYVVTVDGHLNYINAANNTEYVYCEARVRKAGKKVVLCQLDIFGDDGTCFCTGDFNFFRLAREI